MSKNLNIWTVGGCLCHPWASDKWSRREDMMEPKLMSYITSKFSSKGDMMAAEREWQDIISDMLPRFKKAGALRQVVTHVWNQEGSFILGNLWEYVDEKAFIACQPLFREAEVKLNERTGIASIIVPSRGVILHDVRL